MNFLKKNRFKFIITFLILVFIIVSYFLLWVHVPYVTHSNDLNNIQQEICDKHKYTYDNYFNEYNSDKTYYVMKVKVKKKTTYVVYNTKENLVYTNAKKLVSKQTVKDSFKNKYKHDNSSIELGYENSELVYALKYQESDTLIYFYYDAHTGEFIKGYNL
ncbi:MAG: PepSY domain-containing protein [Thomasclavelia sp.]|nr:PepSY domain-containing protein [Thomasclavelia sp.]